MQVWMVVAKLVRQVTCAGDRYKLIVAWCLVMYLAMRLSKVRNWGMKLFATLGTPFCAVRCARTLLGLLG